MNRVDPLLASVLLLAVGQACTQPAARYERELDQARPPERHAVASEQLREVMRGLERLRVERLPQELDPGPLRRIERGKLARLARSLAETAVLVSEAAGDAVPEEQGRREFVALAQELQQQASRLSEEARTSPVNALRARLGEIDATCDACHRRFRIAPQPASP